MANVNIKFNGKDFLLSCENGQEEHLEELSQNLNEKFNQLKSKLGNLGENKLLLITSITLMDEFFETKKNSPYEPISAKPKSKQLLHRSEGFPGRGYFIPAHVGWGLASFGCFFRRRPRKVGKPMT